MASASELPFPAESFDAVWSIFLFHHLPSSVVSAAINEFYRVCKSSGYIVIIDGVLPKVAWKRPLAALIRHMDRGKFMRKQHDIESLLPCHDNWNIQRKTYGVTGLKMLVCYMLKK